MEMLFLCLIGLFVYFLPSIIAWKHRNTNAIFFLNLFLGWTIVGWVVAFVWAMTKDKNEPKVVLNDRPIPTKQNISGDALLAKLDVLDSLLKSKAITQDEYDIRRKEVIKNI